MIALGLLAILLAFLFYSMGQMIKTDTKIERLKAQIQARQHLQIRLQDLFLTITSAHLPALYTLPKEKNENTKELIIYFDHGIDPDPSFSGPIIGHLYLDEQSNLCLMKWPLENGNRSWRKEILISNVQTFHFHFLGQKQKEEGLSISANLAWHTNWPKERVDIPSIIRLYLTHEQENFSFAFFLTTSDPFITYREEEDL
jgi:type II secretory pathway pseudopilin PulG